MHGGFIGIVYIATRLPVHAYNLWIGLWYVIITLRMHVCMCINYYIN